MKTILEHSWDSSDIRVLVYSFVYYANGRYVFTTKMQELDSRSSVLKLDF